MFVVARQRLLVFEEENTDECGIVGMEVVLECWKNDAEPAMKVSVLLS